MKIIYLVILAAFSNAIEIESQQMKDIIEGWINGRREFWVQESSKQLDAHLDKKLEKQAIPESDNLKKLNEDLKSQARLEVGDYVDGLKLNVTKEEIQSLKTQFGESMPDDVVSHYQKSTEHSLESKLYDFFKLVLFNKKSILDQQFN